MHINELMGILNGYFGWNKARMSCFVNILLALIKVRTVNLQDLACAFEGKAKLDSRYKRRLWKQKVYLSALRLPDGNLLILASDKLLEDPFEIYGKRWEIETLFGCLKTKGFCFEDTHITKPERIEKLLFLLTIAFCWAHKIGEWQHEEKPIVIKKHGRKLQSYFRYGLDYLRDVLFNLRQHTTEKMAQLIRQLECSMGPIV
jgi:transposase